MKALAMLGVPLALVALQVAVPDPSRIIGGGMLAVWVEPSGHAFLSKGTVAENGRCPVCSAQHQHYYREDWAERANKDFPCAGTVSVNGRVLSDCRQATPDQAPPDRIVRCKRCNAAFYQDVESKPTSSK